MAGKRLFYTGDFRLHGRKAALESLFVAWFGETPGRVFVSWSAQNIDRTVDWLRDMLCRIRLVLLGGG